MTATQSKIRSLPKTVKEAVRQGFEFFESDFEQSGNGTEQTGIQIFKRGEGDIAEYLDVPFTARITHGRPRESKYYRHLNTLKRNPSKRAAI